MISLSQNSTLESPTHVIVSIILAPRESSEQLKTYSFIKNSLSINDLAFINKIEQIRFKVP